MKEQVISEFMEQIREAAKRLNVSLPKELDRAIELRFELCYLDGMQDYLETIKSEMTLMN